MGDGGTGVLTVSKGGNGTIRLIDSGPVTFSGSNTYTGSLFLDPGSTLHLANPAAASNRPIHVDNATLRYTDGVSIPNTIPPTGTLTMAGKLAAGKPSRPPGHTPSQPGSSPFFPNHRHEGG